MAHNVDKGSGKDTSIYSLAYLDHHFVPAPLVWLCKTIRRDTGVTGIIAIGDRSRHSEDKMVPVESNCNLQ